MIKNISIQDIVFYPKKSRVYYKIFGKKQRNLFSFPFSKKEKLTSKRSQISLLFFYTYLPYFAFAPRFSWILKS